MPLSVVAKVVHDQWRPVLIWTVLSGILAAFYLALYPSIGAVEEMQKLLESMPPALRAMFAAEGVDIGTPAGYLNIELFAFMLPLLVFAVALTAGGGATAGEEERGTLELLLANPLPRWRVVVEKFLALAIAVTVFAVGIWLALAITSSVADIDLDLARVAAALTSTALLGLAVGSLAVALGALTGSRVLSMGLALVVAVAGFFINALGPLVEALDAWRGVSLVYHYIGYDPLANGLDATHAAVLLASSLAFLLVALVAFERRDLHG
jgi:ABC-2 type transport system permease protein